MGHTRRAQIQQLFIFLAATLVIGSTIFLSMKLIAGPGGLSDTACKAGDASFLQEVRDTLDERSTYGSRDNAVTISPPCSAIALCFVDYGAIGQASFVGNDSVISASVHSSVQSNIFLRSRDKTVAIGYDERIVLRDPTSVSSPTLTDVCVPARSGKFQFSTIGYGRFIKIAGSS